MPEGQSDSEERILEPWLQTAALALSEAICQSSPDALFVVDDRGLIRYATGRCLDILGYEPGELIGQSIDMLVVDSQLDHRRNREDYARRPEAKQMGRRPILNARHKSGATVPVDVALSPLPAIAGFGPLVQASVRDALPRWSVQKDLLVQSVAMDAAANGIVITDPHGVIRWVNPAVTRMTGYAASELIGQHTRMLKSGLHDDAVYRQLWETVSAGRTWFGEMANRRKDGTIYYEEQHISPVCDANGVVSNLIAIKQDVTDRKLAEALLQQANGELQRKVEQIQALHDQLRELAVRDPLTGLYNRRFFDECLDRELARAARHHWPLSVVAVDIDSFKQINDAHGHAEGDRILVLLGTLLKATIRESDVACRPGGDEFVVLLPSLALEDAVRRAEAWRRSFRERLESPPPGVAEAAGCTLSIGVTALRDGETCKALLQRLDQTLYEAKRAGRDRVTSHV